MPRAFLRMSPMAPDTRGQEGEHTWFHQGFLPLSTGYQVFPDKTSGSALVTDADAGRTIYTWKKDYNSWVNYYATNSDVYEVGVGSRLSGLTVSSFGPKFAAFGPTLYVTNGVATVPIYWSTGAAFTGMTTQTDSTGAVSADVSPKFILAFKNQLIIANIIVNATFAGTTPQTLAAGTYKHLVWWSCPENVHAFGSELGTPGFFNTGYQPIFDESIEITGLAGGEDAFFVFKEHGIYRFNGPPFGGYEVISNSMGCIEPNSIQRIGDEIVFLSQSGFCSLNVRSNAITNYSTNINRMMLANLYHDINTAALTTPDSDGSPQLLSFVKGQGGGTSAQDPEFGLYFFNYPGSGNSSSNWLMVLNLETKEFGYRLLSNSPSVGVIGWEPHNVTTGYPTGGILLAAQNGTAHTSHRVAVDLDVNKDVYVRWPFQFSYPDRKISIRGVRPVFEDGNSDGTLSNFDLTVKIYSLTSSGSNYTEAVVTTSTNKGDDMNITVENCPFADKHSVGFIMQSNTTDLFFYNFLGLEVEYEEDVLTGKP